MNYYELLGVTPDSDMAEIKSAYRKLARKFHPDVNPDGMSKFKDISRAYDVLSNIERRKRYDTINGIFKNKQEFKENKSDSVKSNVNESEKMTSAKLDNKINFDLFSLFKKYKSRANKNIPVNGEDINADVSLSLSEALTGCNKVINVLNKEVCPRCNGRRFINGAKCEVCSGTGEYSSIKRINVKIPAKIRNGAKLRVKNEGKRGKFGGKSGDLYLLISIQNDENINFEGLNIFYNVKVSPCDAVLGCELFLPNNLKFKIPPKTSSGQKFRLAGQGLQKNGKIGDMIVTVTIDISKYLSDDEIKMYEKLRKMSN